MSGGRPLTWAGGRLLLVISRIFLVAMIAIAVFPFFWMVLASLLPPYATLRLPPDLSRGLGIHNYIALFVSNFRVSMTVALRNSLIVTTGTTLITVGLASMTAYGFSRYNFPFKDSLYVIMLVGRSFPVMVLVIPFYLVLRMTHLIDTLYGLILVYTILGLPFVTWFMRNYFDTTPRELEDAARIDGAGEARVLVEVVLPIAKPALAAVTLLQIFACWNEFFMAVILVNSMATQTMPLRAAAFAMERTAQLSYTMQAAAGVVTAGVPVLLAVAFQRHIVSGLTAGAIR